MEKIVVSDTNIFIDLISVSLLDGFFSLPWEIHNTDMIMKELKDSNHHDTAITKLQSLFSINTRLPKDEIDKRIEVWGQSMHQ